MKNRFLFDFLGFVFKLFCIINCETHKKKEYFGTLPFLFLLMVRAFSEKEKNTSRKERVFSEKERAFTNEDLTIRDEEEKISDELRAFSNEDLTIRDEEENTSDEPGAFSNEDCQISIGDGDFFYSRRKYFGPPPSFFYSY